MVRSDLLRLAEAIARSSTGMFGQAAIRREERVALTVLSALSDDLLLAPDDRVERLAARPTARAQTGDAKSAARTRLQVRCVDVIDETADVKTFRLALPAGARFSYLAGQFLTLEVEIDHERVARSYTIASSPSRAHLVEITLKRVPGGRVSNWLHDYFKVGDEMAITGPAGKFSYELAPPAEKLTPPVPLPPVVPSWTAVSP